MNESNAVWMDTDQGPMTVRQISGAVARRIVCPVSEGTVLAKGEEIWYDTLWFPYRTLSAGGHGSNRGP